MKIKRLALKILISNREEHTIIVAKKLRAVQYKKHYGYVDIVFHYKSTFWTWRFEAEEEAKREYEFIKLKLNKSLISESK
jgi:hypothetical protein